MQGIVVISCGKHHPACVGYNLGKLYAVDLWHLDIKKQEVSFSAHNGTYRFLSGAVDTGQSQCGGLFNIAGYQSGGKGLVVNNAASQCIHVVKKFWQLFIVRQVVNTSLSALVSSVALLP